MTFHVVFAKVAIAKRMPILQDGFHSPERFPTPCNPGRSLQLATSLPLLHPDEYTRAGVVGRWD